MLQNIRDKTGNKLAFIILMPLIFIFAFFGINSYFVASVDDSIATAGDIKITEAEYRKRLQEQLGQMQSMMGESFNARMFDTPEFKRNVLDRMIDERLLSDAGGSAGLAVSEARLREEIKKQVPSAYINEKFSPEAYTGILNQFGYTPQEFEARLRDNLASGMIPTRIYQTSASTDVEVKRYLALRDQTRDFRYLLLNRPTVAADAIKEEQIKSYFDSHRADFNNEETVTFDYVELNIGTLPMPQPPSDATLQETYQRELSRFGTVEGRLASHILVQLAENSSAEDVKKAQDKAAALLAEIRGGKPFADVARASSEDIGSKEMGGDLGFIDKPAPNSAGALFEPAFTDALFALESGAVSEPVKTSQGFHLIELREIRPAAVQTFEEVRAQLAQEAVELAREERFAELESAMIEASSVAVGSLDEVAKAVEGQVQQVPAFSKGMGFGMAGNAAVQDFVFSDEGKLEGTVSDLIEISPNHHVVVRVTEHKPRAPKSLDEARAEIQAKLSQEQGDKLAKEDADAVLKRLLGGESLDAISATTGAIVTAADAVGRQSVSHDASLVKEVFKMAKPAAADKPIRGLVKLADGRYGLVELSAVKEGNVEGLDQATLDAAREQLKGGLANADMEAFRAQLRSGVEIVIDETKL